MTVDGLLIGFVGIRVMLIRPIGANFDDPMKVAMTEVNLVSALIRTSGLCRCSPGWPRGS